jgi:hypothetical protein
MKARIEKEYKEWNWKDEETDKSGRAKHTNIFIIISHKGISEVVFRLSSKGGFYDSRDKGKATTEKLVKEELRRILGIEKGIIIYQQAKAQFLYID